MTDPSQGKHYSLSCWIVGKPKGARRWVRVRAGSESLGKKLPTDSKVFHYYNYWNIRISIQQLIINPGNDINRNNKCIRQLSLPNKPL